ncbi:MAG TPA: MlaD family protein [Candidatus Omnitrophota bacterium]|nr:MCE family protein [Candidatus Omnitrophota bacterium]HPN66268.1 MlaD family protein [Candidatus Omnitrophota bacterium]HRZ67279.1 MlaD family protein [Candidatus Omnitrophota bacterium]
MLKINNEIKTGVVVVAAALVFMYIFTAMGGGNKKMPDDYKLNVMFNYVSGLEDKSPVKLAGVECGEVEKVAHAYIDDQTKVLVTLNLRGEAKVREDSKIRISTTGLIGEKYIEITGGSKGCPVVAKGATIEGIDPFEMEELIDMGKSLAARLDAAMQDLQKLMGHADGVLVDNKDDIRATIMNLKDSSENLKEFSDDVKRNPWKLLMKGKEAPKDAPKEGAVKRTKTNF